MHYDDFSTFYLNKQGRKCIHQNLNATDTLSFCTYTGNWSYSLENTSKVKHKQNKDDPALSSTDERQSECCIFSR